jgi:Flp pilus assembly secretin CpaC
MTIVNQGLFGTYIDNDFLFNLAIDAAKEKGLAKVLAEPTLTTLTGQEAEFLSGGQFPDSGQQRVERRHRRVQEVRRRTQVPSRRAV